MPRKFTIIVVSLYGLSIFYAISSITQKVPGVRSALSWDHFSQMFKGVGSDLSVRMGPIAFWGIIGFISFLISLGFLNAFARKRKGAIKFSFQPKIYRPLETLQGHLQLFAKKPIVCRRMTLTLRCVYHSSGSGNSNRNHVAYKDTQVLLGEVDIPAGTGRQLPFSFQIPAKVDSAFEKIEKHLKMTGTMGHLAHSFIKVASQFEGMNAKWELVAHLEAEGVDLLEMRRVEVKFNRSE